MAELLTHSQCLFTQFGRLFLNVEDRYYSTHDFTILRFGPLGICATVTLA